MKVRQPYTGNHILDDLLEKARRRAEEDGRLRYVRGYGIHLKPGKTGNFICMGAEDWAAVVDHRWTRKVYREEA